ncbi:hypothetical protein [Leptospira santarosai]|uniref:Uncharacterized protein n=1 Tax=Leptospira santarosai serovar Shermani str. LT 821 TaxID=758847 RepID=A0A097ESS2_9LEPT|nr:hypothetical protein [Leptospira santarosai]AIT10988.1 hypothetical protein LSS_22395 [Leptospira santarosai serovar Shermani str. LT 821]KXZ32226.1 hypothetical protein AYB33_14675 [Leptospira santarosai]
MLQLENHNQVNFRLKFQNNRNFDHKQKRLGITTTEPHFPEYPLILSSEDCPDFLPLLQE